MGKHRNRPGKGHRRTDIPYAQRLAMEQEAAIIANRDHAAQIAMFCQCVAMHELEGIGYKRLVRFSLRFREILGEFYRDPVVGMAHAKRRLEQMGLPISGEFFTAPREGRTKREHAVFVHGLQAVQVAIVCSHIAANDMFGFGAQRLQRISRRVEELSTRYRLEGGGWLLGEMEKIGFALVDGRVMAYMEDDGTPVIPERARKEWKNENA